MQPILDQLAELNTAIAEMAAAVVAGQTDNSEIAATLAEMLEVAKSRTHEPPQVHVNVQPAEVKVVFTPATRVLIRFDHEYDKDTGRILRSIPIYKA